MVDLHKVSYCYHHPHEEVVKEIKNEESRLNTKVDNLGKDAALECESSTRMISGKFTTDTQMIAKKYEMQFKFSIQAFQLNRSRITTIGTYGVT